MGSFAFPGASWDASTTPSDEIGIRHLEELDPSYLKYPGGNDADSYIWNASDQPAADMDTTELLTLATRLKVPGFFTANFTQPPRLTAEWARFTQQMRPGSVPWWEVGDEVWGRWTKSHVPGAEYGKRFLEFAELMEREHPDVVLAANLSLENPGTTWTREALGAIAGRCGIITFTFFAQEPFEESDEKLFAAVDRYKKRFLFLKEQVSQAFPSGRMPRFCNVGLNSVSGKPGPQTIEMVNGVFMALMFGAMAETGTDMAAWWAYHNPYPPRGGDFGLAEQDGARRKHPTFFVFQTLSNHFHGRLAGTIKQGSVEGWVVTRPLSPGETTHTVESLTTNRFATEACLLLVNKSTSATEPLDVSLKGLGQFKVKSTDQVSSGAVTMQDFERPTVRGDGGRDSMLKLPSLPGYSVVTINLVSTKD